MQFRNAPTEVSHVFSETDWPLCGTELTFTPQGPGSLCLHQLCNLGQGILFLLLLFLLLLFLHLKKLACKQLSHYALWHSRGHRQGWWPGGKRGMTWGPPPPNQSSSISHRTCRRCYSSNWLCSLKPKFNESPSTTDCSGPS